MDSYQFAVISCPTKLKTAGQAGNIYCGAFILLRRTTPTPPGFPILPRFPIQKLLKQDAYPAAI